MKVIIKGYEVLIDEQDIALLSRGSWHIRDTTGKGKKRCLYVAHSSGQYLHRMINQTPKGKYTDHVNGNRLDNRRENLRTVDAVHNVMNQACRNPLKVKGVWRLPNGRYRTKIKVSGVSIHGGYFKTIEEAAARYDQLALEHFGEYARING